MSPGTPLPREGGRFARFGSTNGKQDRDSIRSSIVDTLEEETLRWDTSPGTVGTGSPLSSPEEAA